MKKKYTKKQITEAIAYWEKQLKTMNESSSDATYKCVAITQVIMAYMKHKINIDADYLLNQVYQMASTMTSMDEVYSIRDQILDGRQIKESSSKHAYLDSVLPKNGIILYDDAGKKLNFGFKLNSGMAAGWTGIDKSGNVVCLSDLNSGYDGKDISIPLLSMFLKDYGYELVDER